MRCASLIVWSRNMGFGKLYHCDIFHRNFVRNLLKSFKFTPICMLYGETSSYNISANMTHFWLNLILDLKIHLTWKIIWLILKAVINITSPNFGPLHMNIDQNMLATCTTFNPCCTKRQKTAFFVMNFKKMPKITVSRKWGWKLYMFILHVSFNNVTSMTYIFICIR